ncbi:MerR family transcriptional regulator [Peribacillus frigoritolerans]|uniref:MerR family transcriptional regulator n=1 Tax=Peribacillus frigoritolerans TaxID=450367 RepID=UPI003D2A747B
MYRIGELSKLLGVSEHTLRYYEKEGLVVPLRKGKNRIYSEEDRELLEFILHMKNTGMALVDIKKYTLMRKDENGDKHAQELMEILVKHRDDVAAQLKIYEENLVLMNHKISKYQKLLNEHQDKDLFDTFVDQKKKGN